MASSQVFHSLIRKSSLFNKLSSEIMQSGVIRMGDNRIKLTSKTVRVKTFSAALETKLEGVAELSIVTLPSGPLAPEWSLLFNSPYSVTSKASKGDGLSSMCCRIITEVVPAVLESRRKLLESVNAMDLRLSLWLSVNQWLLWNPSKLVEGRFNYWDKIPDQIPMDTALYSGPKAERICQLLMEDLKRLKELGDYLTRCSALANNPCSPVADAVISLEMKVTIDAILDVGTPASNTLQGADARPSLGCS